MLGLGEPHAHSDQTAHRGRANKLPRWTESIHELNQWSTTCLVERQLLDFLCTRALHAHAQRTSVQPEHQQKQDGDFMLSAQ